MALQDDLTRADADVFVPDGTTEDAALRRVTDLIVVAHADDAEFAALVPIFEAFDHTDRWVCVCVCTDGARSPRGGAYADVSDEEMVLIRRREQREAATIGRYGCLVQLGHPSDDVRDRSREVVCDIGTVLERTRAHTVWTHEPADVHPTHVAVSAACVEACRKTTLSDRPHRLHGCAGWRSLDWVTGDRLLRFDVSASQALSGALMSVFESQIAGGKRYDLAAAGRQRAAATLSAYGDVDSATHVVQALDMTELLDPAVDPATWLAGVLEAFVQAVLEGFSGRLLR